MFETKTKFTTQEGNNTALSVEVKTETESSIREDVAIPANTTNKEVDIDFVFSRAKNIFITSDKALTLKTNDTTTPGDTISLPANVPVIYDSQGVGTNPFTADVTRFYFTNAAAAGQPDANVKIRIAYDPTP